MASIIASLIASLGLESANFHRGLSEADKALKKTQKSFAAVGGNLQKIGAVMTVGITAPFTALVSAAIPAAIESQQAMAQVNAALASMGPVAGRTADQLQAAAGKLQDISVFDDDDILKSVTANLLTFGKVAGDAFDRAQLAAVNLSARLGTDLQSSALMLGKALNDPVKGITALTRSGVSFTAAQKEQIKAMVAAGDTAGAQGLILGELEKQFGGAAAAQRGATPTAEMDQAWRTFQETVGAAAMQALPAVTNALTGLLTAFNSLSPGTQSFVIGAAAVAAAVGPLLAVVGTAVTGIGALLPVLMKIPAALAILRTAIMVQAIPAVVAFMVSMAPILLPLAAVAAAIGAVVLVVKNWDTIKVYALKVVAWMGQLYTGVKTWLQDKLGAVLNWVGEKVRGLTEPFRYLWDKVVGNSYIPDLVDGIAHHMARLDGAMVDPVVKGAAKATAAFKAMADEVRPLLAELFPEAAALNDLDRKLATIEKARKAGAAGGGLTPEQADEARRRLIRGDAGPAPAIEPIGDEPLVDTTSAIDELMKTLPDLTKIVGRTTDQVIGSFADMAHGVIGAIGGITDRLRSKDWLGALEGVLDIVTQLAGFGVFGKSAQTNVRAYDTGGIAGRRALGGPVQAGQLYEVGERGREWFMPTMNGRIIPNGGLDAANDRGGRITFDMRGAVVTRDLLEQMDSIAANRSATVFREGQAQQARAARYTK